MEINAVIFPFPAVFLSCRRIAFGDGELCEPTMHFHPQFSPINIDGFPIPEIRFSHTAGIPVTIRHLRRRCLYTINTQQGLTSYAFGLHLLIPTVLSTIYRLRRIPNLRISGPQFPISNSRFTVSDGFPDFRFRNSRFPIPDSRFPIPGSRFPIPQFPVPNFRFPVPNSRFPIPDSRAAIPDFRFLIPDFGGKKGTKPFKSERFVKSY